MWNIQPLVCTGVNTKLPCVIRRKRTGCLPWGKYSSSENIEWSSRKCCRENYWLRTAGSVRVEPSKRGYEADQLLWYQFTKLYDARRRTLHSTTHIKVTSCPYCSIVVQLETARRRVWRDCQRGVHSTLVILGAAWYPLPEGTIQFQEMPLMKSLPARKLSLDDCQKLTEFASVHGRAVRQTSVRQETTMAEAGTSPPACYHQTSLRVHRVMLRLGSNHDESDAPPQPVESNSADSDESEDEVEDIEFDSDESDGNDCVEDGARLHNYDEPQLSSETLFQVGRRSRFGRTIRFNGRFIQYISIDWSKVRLPHFGNCWSSTI